MGGPCVSGRVVDKTDHCVQASDGRWENKTGIGRGRERQRGREAEGEPERNSWGLKSVKTRQRPVVFGKKGFDRIIRNRGHRIEFQSLSLGSRAGGVALCTASHRVSVVWVARPVTEWVAGEACDVKIWGKDRERRYKTHKTRRIQKQQVVRMRIREWSLEMHYGGNPPKEGRSESWYLGIRRIGAELSAGEGRRGVA